MKINKKILLEAAALAAGSIMFISIATAADVLDIGSGAKSIGLGRTNTSTKADAYGILGNPASLRGVTTGEIVSMYGTMSNDITYTMLGYVMPTKYGKFFAGYANNQTPDFTSTALDPITGRPVAVSNFDFRNDLFMLGYQNSMTKAISYGLRVKYYSIGSSTLANLSASGLNADAGVLIEANDKLTLGMTAKNIIPGQAGAIKLHNGQTEDLPGAVDIGLGFSPNEKISLYTDVLLTKNIPAEGKVGIEFKPVKMLAIRLGGEQKSSGAGSSYINGSAGVGLQFGIFGIDYAYYYDSLLVTNSRHFVSISIRTPGVNAPEPQYKDAAIKSAAPKIADSSQQSADRKEKFPITNFQFPISNERKQEVKSGEYVEYIVKEGDCLSKIVERLTGHWRLCYKIAKDNNIKNPDLIFPGQKIVIKK